MSATVAQASKGAIRCSMVVLGGAGSLFGPVLGAIVLIILEEVLSGATVYWPIILGAILIAVVLFARGGLEGAQRDGRRQYRGHDLLFISSSNS